jgi:hypothetical protein
MELYMITWAMTPPLVMLTISKPTILRPTLRPYSPYVPRALA